MYLPGHRGSRPPSLDQTERVGFRGRMIGLFLLLDHGDLGERSEHTRALAPIDLRGDTSPRSQVLGPGARSQVLGDIKPASEWRRHDPRGPRHSQAARILRVLYSLSAHRQPHRTPRHALITYREMQSEIDRRLHREVAAFRQECSGWQAVRSGVRRFQIRSQTRPGCGLRGLTRRLLFCSW